MSTVAVSPINLKVGKSLPDCEKLGLGTKVLVKNPDETRINFWSLNGHSFVVTREPRATRPRPLEEGRNGTLRIGEEGDPTVLKRDDGVEVWIHRDPDGENVFVLEK